MTEDDSGTADGEPETTNGGVVSERYRWKYLSTTVTLFVVGAYSGLAVADAAGATTGFLDPGTWATFSVAFAAAIAYSLGIDTLRDAADVVRGGGS